MLGYRPGLDGVRGVAILLVLAWHSSAVPIPPLGLAGVTIFFVLSGFLITRLLIEERERSGRISLGAFYWRRAARLLPALFLMFALTLPFRPDQWWSAGWALSYVGNWWWATGHDTGMYGITWSLAIEEQFYLVWPLLLVAARPRWWTIAVAIGLLVLLRLVPQSREFATFSTLSHAPSLLIGVLLAFRLREGRRVGPLWLLIGALVTVLGYMLIDLVAGIRVGEQIVAAYGALLVVAGMAGAFAWWPLVALGRISYGVYLWHLPVLVILGAQAGLRGPVFGVAGCLLAIGIAWAAFRYVEHPLLLAARGAGLPLAGRLRRSVP